jgi:hypothetical protein
MSEILELTTTTELPLDTAAKRALIESELRENPQRSDREIARLVDCDHKTVAAHRKRLGPATPIGNSPPISPWKPAPPAKEPEFDPFDNDGEDLVVRHQPAIAIYLNPWNAVVIRQRDDMGGDSFVFVCEEHLQAVISKLSEMLCDLRHAKKAAGQ